MKPLIALLMTALTLFAGVPAGQPFPETVLPDQFGTQQQVTASDRIVLISFEKGVSTAVNDYLQGKPKTFLTTHYAKFISDISPMPTLITKMFALPKMRDYGYPVLLIYDDAGKAFEKKEGMLSVYRLESGTVVSVDFVAPSALATVFGE